MIKPNNRSAMILSRKGVGARIDEETTNQELIIGAAKNDIPRMQAALRMGADVNAREGRSGMTALHHAAINGHRSSVAWLLKQPGIIPYLHDDSNRMPLDLAATFGYRDTHLFLELQAATFAYSFKEIEAQGGEIDTELDDLILYDGAPRPANDA